MFSKTALLALAAASAAQASTPQGFNYGSTMNGQPRTEADFESDFKGAQQLQGTNGAFNSARLYTMIDGINTDPSTHYLSALDAAATTKTQLLLGLWMSGTGQDDEIKALKTALNNKALVDSLSSLVLGISVGSEDLYRISPTGLAAPDAAPGSGPDLIVKYIKEVREAIAGTPWAHVPVGHVDTWTAWVNGSNSDVITNSDFLGVDAYPYWQNTEANSVSNGKSLFNEAMDNTKGVSQGKPVWITELVGQYLVLLRARPSPVLRRHSSTTTRLLAPTWATPLLSGTLCMMASPTCRAPRPPPASALPART